MKEQFLSDKREDFWEEVPVSLSADEKQDFDKPKEEKMTYHYKGREREVWIQERQARKPEPDAGRGIV